MEGTCTFTELRRNCLSYAEAREKLKVTEQEKCFKTVLFLSGLCFRAARPTAPGEEPGACACLWGNAGYYRLQHLLAAPQHEGNSFWKKLVAKPEFCQRCLLWNHQKPISEIMQSNKLPPPRYTSLAMQTSEELADCHHTPSLPPADTGGPSPAVQLLLIKKRFQRKPDFFLFSMKSVDPPLTWLVSVVPLLPEWGFLQVWVAFLHKPTQTSIRSFWCSVHTNFLC